MHVKQVAPGKVAVPRDKGGPPTMQIQCEFGVAIRMADDLCAALDESSGPQLTVVEPPANNEQTPQENPSDTPPAAEAN